MYVFGIGCKYGIFNILYFIFDFNQCAFFEEQIKNDVNPYNADRVSSFKIVK